MILPLFSFSVGCINSTKHLDIPYGGAPMVETKVLMVQFFWACGLLPCHLTVVVWDLTGIFGNILYQ